MAASPTRTSRRLERPTGLPKKPWPVLGASGVGEPGPGVRSPAVVACGVGVDGTAVLVGGTGVLVGGTAVLVGVGCGPQLTHGGSVTTFRFVNATAAGTSRPGVTFETVAGVSGTKSGEFVFTGPSLTW
jgi:hypothetical protein